MQLNLQRCVAEVSESRTNMAGMVEARTVLAVIARTLPQCSIYLYQHQRMNFVQALFKRLAMLSCVAAEATLIAH